MELCSSIFNGYLYCDQVGDAMTTEKIYTPSSTSVEQRWRKIYGYTPASEQPFYQQKWAEFRALCAKGVESLEPAAAQEKLNRMRKKKND
jgi:hypothetical protein